jgi:hypothetical protein
VPIFTTLSFEIKISARLAARTVKFTPALSGLVGFKGVDDNKSS